MPQGRGVPPWSSTKLHEFPASNIVQTGDVQVRNSKSRNLSRFLDLRLFRIGLKLVKHRISMVLKCSIVGLPTKHKTRVGVGGTFSRLELV